MAEEMQSKIADSEQSLESVKDAELHELRRGKKEALELMQVDVMLVRVFFVRL